jgi:threonine synthase
MHALKKLQNESAFDSDEKTLLFLAGNAMKYFDAFEIERDQTLMLNRNANLLLKIWTCIPECSSPL